MVTKTIRFGAWLPVLGLVTGLVSNAVAPQPAAAVVHRRTFAQRHPILTGAAVAGAAHHYGKKRQRVGRHRNFAERHPILSGAAAAAVVHHTGKHRK